MSTISATYLIQNLPMDQVCALESEDFPSVSMVYAKKPKFPARVYASPADKLAIFICEVPLPQRVHRAVAYTLLDWAKARGIPHIVTMEGLPAGPDAPTTGEPEVWGVGSTDEARARLDAAHIDQLETGMIAGVSGVLLNEGRWRKVDVIALLAAARAEIPDAGAAVSLVRSLDQLLPKVKVDLTALKEQAKALEGYLQRLKQQAAPVVPTGEPEVPEDMYR